MESTLESKVKRIIAEHLAVEEQEITSSSSLVDDLGADSLDLVEIVMQCEEEFNIEIPDEDADKLKTIQDLYDYLGKVRAV